MNDILNEWVSDFQKQATIATTPFQAIRKITLFSPKPMKTIIQQKMQNLLTKPPIKTPLVNTLIPKPPIPRPPVAPLPLSPPGTSFSRLLNTMRKL